MGKYRVTCLVIGLLSGVLFTSCETASTKLIEEENAQIEQSRQALKNARTDYLAEVERSRVGTEQEIELNQEKIDMMKTIMVNLGPEAIKRYRKDMHALQRTNHDLKMALGESADD